MFGASCMIRYSMTSDVPVPNGDWPPAAKATVTAQVKMSAAVPARPVICSGAMYAGRADGDAGPGQAGRVQRLGDAEVDDLRPGRGEQHVGGLEVAVHDAGRVDRGQRLRQPGGQAVQHLGVERAAFGHVLGQRGAVGVLGDQERLRRLGVGLDDPDRAHALDPGQRGHLAAEPGTELRVVGQFGAQDLDRDRVAVLGLGQVDDAHPARAQPGRQAVPADPRRVCLLQRRACHQAPFRSPFRDPCKW